MQKNSLEEFPCFVIEQCRNCDEHQWDFRHNEMMYNEYFQKVGKAISDQIPEACIMRNQIPKGYVNFDLYVNLVANDDETIQTYA